MSNSQMGKYVWASVLYYVAAVVGFLIAVPISMFGILWGVLAVIGYLTLITFLNFWRRRRHPRSAYQVELAKRRLDG
ncbi:hypothetical protein [Mesorhizobium sp. B2-3-4]|uniref:hypothetical protein n=1 Tax=Mesorhizobium sp. B2-3-4 TaxID=2589959 RepID=UPI00112B25FE|nr:hypothetical protein [Mesorhizobium sp. B2-3-4]TPM26081.1 hypothetical protein FJ967_31715 [Mesorhizobium sp. B2-3-4]